MPPGTASAADVSAQPYRGTGGNTFRFSVFIRHLAGRRVVCLGRRPVSPCDCRATAPKRTATRRRPDLRAARATHETSATQNDTANHPFRFGAKPVSLGIFEAVHRDPGGFSRRGFRKRNGKRFAARTDALETGRPDRRTIRAACSGTVLVSPGGLACDLAAASGTGIGVRRSGA